LSVCYFWFFHFISFFKERVSPLYTTLVAYAE
jgi:hypothetical protein